MFVVKRSEHNPILVPDRDHYWEGFATFNLCPIRRGKTFYGLYRAISAPDVLQNPRQISVIGIGESPDGIHFKNRLSFITPEEQWEKFGCEDPRVTFFEGTYYIFYTALSKYPFVPAGIQVAVALSRDLKKIDRRYLVTPFNAKAMVLFPERINGKIVVVFSYHTDSPPARTVFAYLDKIEELWSDTFWKKWQEEIDDFTIDFKRSLHDHTEVGAPPLKTKHGWLLVYSHIQNYFPSSSGLPKIFGIEGALLDLKNPQKIIGRTRGPILVPEESYELSGFTQNVVFPTGALIAKDTLTVYYGAADTTACFMRVNLTDLLSSIHYGRKNRFHFRRSPKNPIIVPRAENVWEARATFNPAAIMLNKKVHLVYRALSGDNTSTLGYARVENYTDVVERSSSPIYVPRENFESKKSSDQGSGCEDPRLTKIGKNIYLCYTAYDGVSPPRVAISSISEKDFVSANWKWQKPFLVTPPDIDDKDACLFPEKFKLGYFILHRIDNEVCGDYLSSLDFRHEVVKRCIKVIGPRANTWDGSKVGVSAPPVKTKHGWLLLYHGVSKSHNTYRIGCVLLDLKDPAVVLARSADPIFEPEEQYEKSGTVNNVVFPCGMVVRPAGAGRRKMLYIYYGGGDRVVGVASMELDVVLKALVHGVKL